MNPRNVVHSKVSPFMWLMHLICVIYVGFVGLCGLQTLSWSLLFLFGCPVELRLSCLGEVVVIW